MNTKRILPIIAILGTASILILGNLAVPAYSVLSHAGQSQANTDPQIGKQVLRGVALILNGVNIILMGNTSGGLDQISLGDNMIRSTGTYATNNLGVESGTSASNTNNCNIVNGGSGANGSQGSGASGGAGGKGGFGGASCGYGGIAGNGGITPDRGSANGGSTNGGNGDSGGRGGSVFAH